MDLIIDSILLVMILGPMVYLFYRLLKGAARVADHVATEQAIYDRTQQAQLDYLIETCEYD
jgi:cell division protein FtsB